jgi:hypothetical protein
MDHILLSEMMDVLTAACVSWTVDCNFDNAGGIFLVSSPEQLKTTILAAMASIDGVHAESDLTTRKLTELRDRIAAKRIRTLLFYDFQKLYERRGEVASNIMGNLRSIMDEGFTNAGNESDSLADRQAKAFVMAAMTPDLVRAKTNEWSSGISRRVLFSRFDLENPREITEAIHRDKKINLLKSVPLFQPLPGQVPMSATDGESRMIERFISDQHGTSTPLILMRKILSVMRWRNRALHRRDNSFQTLQNFSKTLKKGGCDVRIDL